MSIYISMYIWTISLLTYLSSFGYELLDQPGDFFLLNFFLRKNSIKIFLMSIKFNE